MKRTVFAKISVNDEINNGQVLDTLEKQALEMAHCDLEEAICAEADSDSKHERYINYLINWAIEHNDEAFEGCSPASFDEFEDCEDEEEDCDIALEDDDYYLLPVSGYLVVYKQVFDDYVENSYINIKFLDEDNAIHQYKMIKEDDKTITMEFIG